MDAYCDDSYGYQILNWLRYSTGSAADTGLQYLFL